MFGKYHLPDPTTEAERLRNDPEYLRRKALYILEQAERGGPLEAPRRQRAAELLAEAERLTHNAR